MKLLLIVLFYIIPLLSATPLLKRSPRIVNGHNATQGQFPWQAALFVERNGATYFNGASIIGDRWLLTAAQSVEDGDIIYGLIGTINFLDGTTGTYVDARSIHIHPDYSPVHLRNDIALIYLEEEIVYDENINKIQLSAEDVEGDVDVFATGWGLTSDTASGLSEILQYGELRTLSNEECNTLVTGMSDKTQICAISTDETHSHSPCNGDSGSPLFTNSDSPVQVGIFSFLATLSCEARLPSGYTRVSNYIEWIRNVTGIEI